MKRIVPALFLAMALGVCGCSAPQAEGASTTEPVVELDPTEIATGTPAFDGWLDGAVEYLQAHNDEKGVLVSVTGLMSQGFSEDTVSQLTLIMPSTTDEEWDPMEPAEIKEGDICADVYFAEPVEVTRWAHLMGVRGMATLDPNQENKIIIRGAIEDDD